MHQNVITLVFRCLFQEKPATGEYTKNCDSDFTKFTCGMIEAIMMLYAAKVKSIVSVISNFSDTDSTFNDRDVSDRAVIANTGR